MGYTITIEVKSEEQATLISKMFNSLSEFEKIDGIKCISTDWTDHGYHFRGIEHAVYITHDGTLTHAQNGGFWNIAMSISKKLGDIKMFFDNEKILWGNIKWHIPTGRPWEVPIYERDNETLLKFKLLWDCSIKHIL